MFEPVEPVTSVFPVVLLFSSDTVESVYHCRDHAQMAKDKFSFRSSES